jgi:carbonic anhydrase
MDLIYRYDPHQAIAVQTVPDGDAAVALLSAGNARFVDFVTRMHRRTLGAPADEPVIVPICPVSLGLPFYDGIAPKQAPYAAVLGCADARVPIETVFDQWFNDLFVVRVAGNVLGNEGLASLHYAVRNFTDSMRLLLVLGHSQCGAVTAAVDSYLEPHVFAHIARTHALRTLVDRILLAVRGASIALEDVGGSDLKRHPNYRDALIDTAVHVNAAVTAYDLAAEERLREGPDLRVVYGVYDLAGVQVRAWPAAGAPTFADAPARADDFVTVGRQVAEAVIAARLTTEKATVTSQ